MTYEKRIVAFIDILGFKSLINGTEKPDNQNEIENITGAFDLIHKVLEKHYSEDQIKEIKYSTFSDCIVFSFPSFQTDALFFAFLPFIWLQADLVSNHNIFLRGAITIGDIYHDEKKVFGPAMVKAYELESKVAKYPRIILDPEIKTAYDDCLVKLEEEGDFDKIYDLKNELNGVFSKNGLLSKDSDGYYYIDYIEGIYNEMDSPENYPNFIQHIESLIQPYLKPDTDESLLRKYVWLDEKLKKVKN